MSSDLEHQIDKSNLPEHIAVIMDGNGRWAKQKNMPRIFGHKNGVKSVREITEAAAELGIKYLTLYAFSTENWNRPAFEVTALMTLLVETIRDEVATLNKNDIRLNAIGDITKLPKRSYNALVEAIENTSSNSRMTLNLALNYSSRWEIIDTVKKIADQVKKGDLEIEDINQDYFSGFLNTAGMPDPELLIRTSGEKRISNYLLWQLAYSELHFVDIFWPDFRKKHLYESIIEYQSRERRFGKTSEQLV